MRLARPPGYEIPHGVPGRTIGLLGGSFDPPHAGHVHITRQALHRFGLDQVWWLVSPGNPLKASGPAPLERRMAAARRLMAHPKVIVTDIEARIGTRYTAETIAGLRRLYPQLKFVWLMGADNLAEFHKWEQWEWIMQTVPIGVLARPGDRLSARCSIAASRYGDAMLRGRSARLVPAMPAPCWCLVNVPMVNFSSTAIRARGEWER